MRSVRQLITEMALVFLATMNAHTATVVIGTAYSFPEQGGSATISLVRNGDAGFAFSVDYVLSESSINSAKAWIDFRPQTGTVRLEAGERLKEFELPNPVIDNGTIDRRDRYIRISLTNASAGVTVGEPAYVGIVDNELPNIVDPSFRLKMGEFVFRATPLGAATDGKVLALINSTNITQLMPDGRLDTAFQPFGINDPNLEITLAKAFAQTNGDWVVCLQRNDFSDLRDGDIMRLRRNGSVDLSFAPIGWLRRYFGGENAWLHKSAVQSEGQLLVLIGDSTGRNAVVRLKSDGSRDEQFTPIRNEVAALLVQADDRILAAHQSDNPFRTTIARYQRDGTIDPSFEYAMAGTNNTVRQLALQSDQKILLAGEFPGMFGTYGSTIIRLHPDGSRDLLFQMEIDEQYQLQEMIVLANGRIAAAYPGEVRRFHPDGGLDAIIPMSFWMTTPTVLADGRLLMSIPVGWFSTLARLDLTDASRPGMMFAYPAGERISIHPLVLEEWRAGESTSVAIRRLGDSSRPLTITASTRNGTAKGGEDFVPQATEITFAPFETEKSLKFQLLDDSQLELDEHFDLVLNGREVLGQPQLEVRIINDDDGALLGSPRLKGENAEIVIEAIDGAEWRVETSLDLKKWAVEGFEIEIDVFGRPARVVDPGASQHPRRFYRLTRR